MAVTLRYFNEFGKRALQKTVCGGIYASLLHFLVSVQFRRKESSRSLSHLLMSFLFWKVGLVDLVFLACVLRATTKKSRQLCLAPHPNIFF